MSFCYQFDTFQNGIDTLLTQYPSLTEQPSKVYYRLLSSMSASYITSRNWQINDNSAFIFLGNVDFRHRRVLSSGWSHEHHFKSELGYIGFHDSAWIKNIDQWKIALQWTEKPGKYLSHSYSFYIMTQMLKSWSYRYDEPSGEYVKNLKSWFMAPGVVEMAYGLNWKFWEYSRVNIAFATCRLSSKPRINDDLNEQFEKDEMLFKSKRRYIKTEYGFSAQLYINKEIYPKLVLWDHQCRLFFNALNSRGIDIDISNRFTIRFLKFMQFRIDTRIVYEPDFSKKISFRQEMLLGIFYELKK